DYRLLFDVDPQHRGIAHVADRGGQTAIFEIDHPTARIALGRPAPSRELAVAIRAGVRHIWTGYDHLLFLLALLLPCMLSRTPAGGWQGVSSIGAAVRRIAAVVTAFTLAHSLTLSLAALDLMQLPSRLVESLIAASVVAAAVNNLLPAARAHGWFVACALGLLHGFGFAGARTDAGLSGAPLALTLLGFNLGVELGQLTIVALFVPLAFAARNTVGYRRVLLLGGSGAIAVVALVWFVERAFT
ncbi:MAG TPA: HupE/UreJ family protein, partial [Gemmatimonadales bacterium]